MPYRKGDNEKNKEGWEWKSLTKKKRRKINLKIS